EKFLGEGGNTFASQSFLEAVHQFFTKHFSWYGFKQTLCHGEIFLSSRHNVALHETVKDEVTYDRAIPNLWVMKQVCNCFWSSFHFGFQSPPYLKWDIRIFRVIVM